MDEPKNFEIKKLENKIFAAPQMVNTSNGIKVPKRMLDEELYKPFSLANTIGCQRKDFEGISRQIKQNNMAKKRVLAQEQAKGFISVTLVTIMSILLVTFGIVKVIGTIILK